MATLERWKSGLVKLLRAGPFIPAAIAASLILGFGFVSIASITESTPRATRQFSGQVPAFTEGRDALEVPGAAYDRAGFADARTASLRCGVSVVFLTQSERQEFLDVGKLPVPQLRCDQPTARLPGSIAAVFVENQRANISDWAFDLIVFDVSYPHAVYGVAAIGLLLVAGVALPVALFQRVVPRWIETRLTEKKE